MTTTDFTPLIESLGQRQWDEVLFWKEQGRNLGMRAERIGGKDSNQFELHIVADRKHVATQPINGLVQLDMMQRLVLEAIKPPSRF